MFAQEVESTTMTPEDIYIKTHSTKSYSIKRKTAYISEYATKHLVRSCLKKNTR